MYFFFFFLNNRPSFSPLAVACSCNILLCKLLVLITQVLCFILAMVIV